MKKGILYLSVIFLSCITYASFSYQPAERGLIFGEKFKNREQRTAKKGFDKKMVFAREKRQNGEDSLVIRVSSLSQFLTLSANFSQPVVVRIFNQDQQYQEFFQKAADKFKNKAIFVSFNSLANEILCQVFLTVLTSKGIALPTGNDLFPMFLFCNPNFVAVQDNSVGFRKDSLKILAVRFLKDETDLCNMINRAFMQLSDNLAQDLKNHIPNKPKAFKNK
jgi:hypothetical protein